MSIVYIVQNVITDIHSYMYLAQSNTIQIILSSFFIQKKKCYKYEVYMLKHLSPVFKNQEFNLFFFQPERLYIFTVKLPMNTFQGTRVLINLSSVFVIVQHRWI